MTGPRQDNATLTEELLAAADRLSAVSDAAPLSSLQRRAEPGSLIRQAALIRALVAEHAVARNYEGSSWPLCRTCDTVNPWPCTTIRALAACFLSSGSTVPGVTK